MIQKLSSFLTWLFKPESEKAILMAVLAVSILFSLWLISSTSFHESVKNDDVYVKNIQYLEHTAADSSRLFKLLSELSQYVDSGKIQNIESDINLVTEAIHGPTINLDRPIQYALNAVSLSYIASILLKITLELTPFISRIALILISFSVALTCIFSLFKSEILKKEIDLIFSFLCILFFSIHVLIPYAIEASANASLYLENNLGKDSRATINQMHDEYKQKLAAKTASPAPQNVPAPAATQSSLGDHQTTFSSLLHYMTLKLICSILIPLIIMAAIVKLAKLYYSRFLTFDGISQRHCQPAPSA